VTTDRFIKLKFDAYHYIGNGEEQTIVQKLGVNRKAVLECIASHQDTTCHSDITQRQIVQLTGIGLTTVNKIIQELQDFTYEGKPIIEVKQFYEGKKKRNLYKILPNLLVSQYGERANVSEIETLEEVSVSEFETTKEQRVTKELKEYKEDENMRERMTSKEVVSYFFGLLKDKGIDKKPYYPRLMKQMKAVEPLFSDLINNDIKKVCEIISEQYDSWNSNAQYPLEVSVIGRKWVWERAIKELSKEKEAVSQIETQSVEATKRNEKALSSIMDRIKSKGGNK
jgi:biotin operon repressor